MDGCNEFNLISMFTIKCDVNKCHILDVRVEYGWTKETSNHHCG